MMATNIQFLSKFVKNGIFRTSRSHSLKLNMEVHIAFSKKCSICTFAFLLVLFSLPLKTKVTEMQRQYEHVSKVQMLQRSSVVLNVV